MKFLIKTLFPIIIITFFISPSTFGQDKVKLLQVTPLPSTADVKPLQGEFRDPMKGEFDGRGQINRIGKKEIVISDSLWKIASSVSIVRKPSGQAVSMRSLKTGQMVEFVLNRNRKISKLRILEK